MIPPALSPQSESGTFVDDGTTVFRPSQAPGIAQRVQFVEPRLQIKQSFQALRGNERAAMLSIVGRGRGGYATLRALVGYTLRGAFPTSELIINGVFSSGFGSWSNGAIATIGGSDLRMRVTASGSNAGYGAVQTTACSITSGGAYVARAMVYGGRGNSLLGAMGIQVGSASFGGNYLNAVSSGDHFQVGGFVASTSTVFFGVAAQVTGQAGDYFDVGYASLARCALVGSGTWGNANGILVSRLPASTPGLLLCDDLFVINGELKRCTGALDSDANGVGFLQFAPSLFRSPSSGDPVEILRPMGAFMLTDNATYDNTFGAYADVALTMEAIST